MKYRQEEKRIEKEILMLLHRKGIFAWKQNTVGIFDKNKGVYRRSNSPFIISGISDILGIYQSKLLAIEIKTPERRKNVTEDQQRFLENVKKNGGIAFVACSVEDVKDALESINHFIVPTPSQVLSVDLPGNL